MKQHTSPIGQQVLFTHFHRSYYDFANIQIKTNSKKAVPKNSVTQTLTPQVKHKNPNQLIIQKQLILFSHPKPKPNPSSEKPIKETIKKKPEYNTFT